MEKVILSIVVPVYNVEAYLSECLESIINQSFASWELLLVDDGSLDNSGLICDKYATIDHRILVFHKSNGGVCSARNLGIKEASGEWITFVDADDLVEPTFFEGLLCPTKINMNLDFVQGGCTNYSAGLKGSIEQQYTDKISSDFIYLFNNFRGLTVSKLFRLENVKKGFNGLPIKFDENMRFAEDMAFTLDYIKTVESYAFVQEVGYLYRRDNNQSAMHNTRHLSYDKFYYSAIKLYDCVVEVIKAKDIPEDQCTFRYKQRGYFLYLSILNLYETEDQKSIRLQSLRNNYSKHQYAIMKLSADRVLERFLTSLLCNGCFGVFDLCLRGKILASRFKSNI